MAYFLNVLIFYSSKCFTHVFSILIKISSKQIYISNIFKFQFLFLPINLAENRYLQTLVA